MSKDHLGGAIPQGDANTWMPDVWGYLAVKFDIGMMIDVGCGYGHTCKWFSELGIVSVGVDGFPECIEKNVCKDLPRVWTKIHDFSTGPYTHGTPFDLAWSAEFLEHVDEKHLPNLRPCFEAARYAVITHGEPHQHGHNHVNCKPDSYWIKVFDGWNFDHSPTETELLRRTDRFHAAWGRRSLMFFKRR